MARESYNDLIFELGDLAREYLADAKNPPKAMEAVFAAEDAVLEIRREIEQLEAEMNAADAEYQDFLAQQEAEREEQNAIIQKWRAAVAGVEVRSRDLKKKLSSMRAAFRYQKVSLKRQEEKHRELELREGHDAKKIALSKENLKKARLHIMREQRHLEELEWEFNQVLTPRPGQPGAQGILAHKRILEMEDEAEERELEHKERMKQFDEALAAKDEELKAAEEELDACIFDLGEECYAERIPHPKLNPLYPRLDKAG
jgi:seryl-tRNA synthetase